MNRKLIGKRVRTVLAAAALVSGLMIAEPLWAGALGWKNETITVTWFEEDIRVVLDDILKRNGKQVSFKPEVAGSVTMQLSNMPLEGAFNKVLTENNLDYTYDESNNLVTVTKRTDTGGSDLITTETLSLDQLYNILDELDMRSEVELRPSPVVGSYLVKGNSSAIKKVKDIVKSLDDNNSKKEERRLEREKKQLEVDQQRRELNRVPLDQDMEIRIFPLKYANVDSTSTSFNGEKVSIPGVIDSLRAFIGGIEVRDAKQGDNKDDKQASDTTGNNRPVVSVDKRTNSVIVQGTPEQIKRIETVLKRLDQPVPLVEIEVIIVTGTDDLTKQLGVRWGADKMVGRNREDRALTVNQTGGTTTGNFTSPGSYAGEKASDITMDALNAGILNAGFNAVGGGSTIGFLYRGARAILDAQLNMLETNGQAHTVSAPRVVTMNNLPARVTNSQKYNFVVADTNNSGGSIETVTTGLTLEITPSVLPETETGDKSLLRLDISAQNETPTAITTTSVSTNNQEVQTSVIIPEQNTFILGGLFTNNRAENEEGVPLLKDIPVLGHLFKHRTSQDGRNETVFLITPQVYVQEEVAMNSQGEEVRAYIKSQKDKLSKTNEWTRNQSHLLDLTNQPQEDE